MTETNFKIGIFHDRQLNVVRQYIWTCVLLNLAHFSSFNSQMMVPMCQILFSKVM